MSGVLNLVIRFDSDDRRGHRQKVSHQTAKPLAAESHLNRDREFEKPKAVANLELSR